jgi:hypothetical protein
MSVIRLDRFTVDAAQSSEMLARRNALVDAVRQAVPGLMEARLVRVDDETRIDIWRWDSLDNAQSAAARARAGTLPEAGAAFELARDVVTEFTTIVDER